LALPNVRRTRIGDQSGSSLHGVNSGLSNEVQTAADHE
jgi:hypothetical protein